jgi:hypothetical protein
MHPSTSNLERCLDGVFIMGRLFYPHQRNLILDLTQAGLVPPIFRNLNSVNGFLDAAKSGEAFIVALYYLAYQCEKRGVAAVKQWSPESVLDYSEEEIARYKRGETRQIYDVLRGLKELVRRAQGPVIAEGFDGLLSGIMRCCKCVEIEVAPVESSRVSASGHVFRAPHSERVAFVRALAVERVGGQERLIPCPISELEDEIIMSLPEATILRVVEQYLENKSQPIPDQIVIRYLNSAHANLLRQTEGNIPEMSPPFSLKGYCQHLVRYVHCVGLHVPNEAQISEMVRRSFTFCKGQEIAYLLVTDYGL